MALQTAYTDKNCLKNKHMRILNFILLGFLLILQARLWVGEGSISQTVTLQKKVELQQALNKDLRERNDELAHEVLDLQHGTDAIEEYARTELGMIKPNESFFLVVNPHKKP